MTQRRTVLAAAGVLALLDALLLGGVLTRRDAAAAHHEPGPAARVDWIALGPSDLEVAAVFGTLVREGLPAALDALEAAAAADSAILRDAHQLAHAVGRLAMLRAGRDPRTLAGCREIFSSGCYHGVIEAYLETAHHLDPARLHELCTAARSPERAAAELECVHGLGHGIAGANGHDLDRSLAWCDALPDGQPEWCWRGVFMEVIDRAVGSSAGASSADRTHHQPSASAVRVSADNPYAPCDAVAEKYAHGCWVYQAFVIMRHNGFDFERTLRTCDAAPAGRAAWCYESFGLQIAGLFQGDDAWILERCALGAAALEVHCIEGAAQTLTMADRSAARPLALCARAPGHTRHACYARTGAFLRFQYADEPAIAATCARAGEPFAAACRRGAGLP